MLYAKLKYPDCGFRYDIERVKESGLKRDEKYEVTEVNMGQSHCSICLKGIEGSFNSIQFEYEKDGKPYDIYSDPEYNPYLNIKFLDNKDLVFEAKPLAPPKPNKVIVNVEGMEYFILSTKDKDYVLDFQKLLEDYGVEVKE